MWKRRSHFFTPSTALLSTKEKYIWTLKSQEAFDMIKETISTKIVQSFPDNTKSFQLVTDGGTHSTG